MSLAKLRGSDFAGGLQDAAQTRPIFGGSAGIGRLMRDRGLGQTQMQPRGRGIRDRREIDGNHPRAQRHQRILRAVQHRQHVLAQPVERVGLARSRHAVRECRRRDKRHSPARARAARLDRAGPAPAIAASMAAQSAAVRVIGPM